MNRKIVLFFFLACLGVQSSTMAQSTCPPNIDFEFGNLSYWHFWNGSVSSGPVYSLTTTTPVYGRESLTSGPGLDAVGGFPIVDPGGGTYALKLGDAVIGYLTEKASYYIHVPVGVTNYSLIYRYAVVMQDPGHPVPDQPRFTVQAVDSTTGKPIPCAQDNYVAGALPGFLISGGVYYKPWATASINLSGLGGTTVAIDIIAQDCAQGGHYGYGYFDATCGLFAIDSKICDDTLATLTGPSGFSSYTWFDSSTFSHIFGTTQVITMPIPDTATTFAVIIQPYIGFGCPDTLYTRVLPSYLQVKASNDTLICQSKSVSLFAGATDSAIDMPLTYSWSPALGLSCTTCANPVATPLGTTTYSLVVTDRAGCTKKDVVVVTTDQVTNTIAKINDSCNGFNNGTATVTPITGVKPFTYVWSTIPLQTAPTATALTAGTYSVTVTDNLGCSTVTTTTITQPPPNNLTVTGRLHPTTCEGTDGFIALNGLRADSPYTFTYTFTSAKPGSVPVPGTYRAYADGLGNDTIKGLAAGRYEFITVDITKLPRPRCPFNTIGLEVLKDPATPPIPSVGNNGPICKGDTLKLNAKDAAPGVFFQWFGPSGFFWNLPDTSIANADFFQAGTYTVTVSKAGCQSTGYTKVVVKPIPFPSAQGDTVCSGSDIQLHSSSSNGATAYRWEGPDAYSSFIANPVIPASKFSAAGTYTVTITLDGCSQVDTATVLVVKSPAPPTVTDTTYCQYDSPVPPLNAVGDPAATITWYAANGNLYPGIPQPVTDVAGTTVWYADQQITGPGVVCTSPRVADTVKVYSKYFPSLTVSDTVICTGNVITFMANNVGDDRDGILWSVAAGDSVKDVNPLKHAFDAIGTYTVSVTPLHKFCPNPTLTKEIKVYPYPVINLGPDTAICLGSQSITLKDEINANNPRARWLWNTSETGPSIVVTKPGVYYTRLLINGCPVADTVTVLNDCYLDLPNAFTPNGDGSNDYFFPRQYLTRGLIGFKMDIYNRWGQQVFKTNSLNGLGWDGKFNDVPQPEGVYVYIIDATFKDGQIEHHTGNVTLLR